MSMNKRSYKQNCSLALSSDLLCERWTLLIFRELLIQPCRFKDLNIWLGGMGTNLLSQRLKDLEQQSLIKKVNAQDKRSAYQLTDAGLAVEPVLVALINWGLSELTSVEGYKHFHHWDLLAMKALFKPQNCTESLTVQFDHPELQAWVKGSPEGFSFSMGWTTSADIVLPQNISALRANKGSIKNPKLKRFVACFE